LRVFIDANGAERDDATSMSARLIFIGAIAAVLFAAAPAPASPPGLTRVVATHGLEGDRWRHHYAHCPEGTLALSGGYEWVGGGNDVRLTELQYTHPPKSISVYAQTEVEGVDPLPVYGTSWGMRLYVICAAPLLGQRPVYHIPDIATDDSSAVKSATVRCPAGTSVYGVGGGFHWADRLLVDENWTPNATLTAATVTAQEDEIGTTDGWRAWAEALCAQPVPGLQRVAATSVGGSASVKEVIATCPAGKRVLGMGGDIRRAHGEVLMTALVPNHDLTGVRVTAREDDTGTDASWYAVAYAVCG
jgi:hypothetical protein